MPKPTTGEQQSTDQANEAMTLSEAVRIVREAIAAEEARLMRIVNSDEEHPVLLEGDTSTGNYAQTMADPARVARIMLNYDYPLYKILEEDAPQEMWNELARMVGLKNVGSVDL